MSTETRSYNYLKELKRTNDYHFVEPEDWSLYILEENRVAAQLFQSCNGRWVRNGDYLIGIDVVTLNHFYERVVANELALGNPEPDRLDTLNKFEIIEQSLCQQANKEIEKAIKERQSK